MISIARLRRCVYPSPVYECHFTDGTVSRLSVWQPLGKPWLFKRFRSVHTSLSRGKPKKISSAALRKWAKTILEQIEGSPDPEMAVLTAAAVNDLRAALGQAA